MKLPGTLLQDIREALHTAFPSRFALNLLLREQLDTSLDEIVADQSTLASMMFEVIRWFEARDRVDRLLAKACATNPSTDLREVRRRFQVFLLMRHSFASFEPFYASAARRLAPRVDRFRKHVELIEEDDDNWRSMYELIVWVGDPSGMNDLAPLLELDGIDQAHPLYQAAREALGIVDRPAAPPDPPLVAGAEADALLLAAIRAGEMPRYTGDTYDHLRSILDVAAQALPSSADGRPGRRAFLALSSALLQLQLEDDASPYSVAKYRRCFQFATEDDPTAVQQSFYDNGTLLTSLLTRDNTVVFGGDGHGKTAYFHQLPHELPSDTLVVQLSVNLDRSRRAGSDGLHDEQDWLLKIRELVVKALDHELDTIERRRADLAAAGKNPLYWAIRRAARLEPVPVTLDGVNLRDVAATLRALRTSVCPAAGFAGIYLLVDITAHRPTRPETVATFVRPLLELLTRPAHTGLVIKLFLPSLAEQALRDLDRRARVLQISWDKADMERMLARYIASRHPSEGAVEHSVDRFSFEELLCEPEIGPLDECLVAASRPSGSRSYSPRRLMMLAWSLIQLHLTRDPGGKRLIDSTTAEAILGRCRSGRPPRRPGTYSARPHE